MDVWYFFGVRNIFNLSIQDIVSATCVLFYSILWILLAGFYFVQIFQMLSLI